MTTVPAPSSATNLEHDLCAMERRHARRVAAIRNLTGIDAETQQLLLHQEEKRCRQQMLERVRFQPSGPWSVKQPLFMVPLVIAIFLPVILAFAGELKFSNARTSQEEFASLAALGQSVLQVIGILLAGLAGVKLVVQVMGGQPRGKMINSLMAFLVGMVLVSPHWSLVMALSLLAVAILAVSVFSRTNATENERAIELSTLKGPDTLTIRTDS